ncbi:MULTISPECIES: orotate phosphoribosyltransferase [Candidatus Neomicrothrix]|jgi:orotate phosphoribosyltransferase|uniref:Orotate phosphoribosyltransferase n=1 Tax=Candidatus Neomicrothrix parvicella RN1 TaxID=1229780 RepID=R4YYX6_9ACTN|nr:MULTISPECIES: orotate phosphoribosyltransferase [Microthrix]MBK7020380.1 orotate phosphoribosyltransferase [Candidatus Microthrix sp.]MBL0203758.1 orotate phosphoribosyltransferase [Candidatus Microthrix sp.]MBP6133827.1 orotate phosphoribosyltransferase [Candidatus Microthrix sp.]MBP6148705.1 orotate phosphoribosyltransferase [Candidatus Microthrix sp.]MBP7985607.1 orotate phosphoribosyltransferase [Candidatus Microthrix sp.]
MPITDDAIRADLAHRIYATSHLTGEFTLRSGRVSNEYFDKYRFESDPVLLAEVAEAMATLVPEGIEVLAGLEMGGIPVVTALARVTGLPACFVRKSAKKYGTAKFAEGADVDGKRVLIVEDVITSGGQVVLSTADLRGIGAQITDVVCVIDRSEGGTEALSAEGLTLASVVNRDDLNAAAG